MDLLLNPNDSQFDVMGLLPDPEGAALVLDVLAKSKGQADSFADVIDRFLSEEIRC